ncbi:hypothetical protein LguiA_026784 [Lonicera macranthoides]
MSGVGTLRFKIEALFAVVWSIARGVGASTTIDVGAGQLEAWDADGIGIGIGRHATMMRLAPGIWASFRAPRLISARGSWLLLAKHYFNNAGIRPWEF